MSPRVLHIQDHTIPEMSGYAIRSRYLVEHQRKGGVDAEVISSARHRKFTAPEEVFEGLRFHRTSWPARWHDRAQLRIPFWRERILTAALERRILEVASKFHPQLLHAHSPIFNGQAALRAAKKLGVPCVYEIRAFWEDDAVDKGKFSEGSFVYRQVRRLETSICREAKHVVVICDGLKADLVARGIPDDKVLVVPNGVDTQRFQPLARDEALARRTGLEGKIIVGFIGSFFHYEGLPLLAEAGARLRDRYPNLRIVFVGGGEDDERTRAKVTELNLDSIVHFAGRVPHHEVNSWYSLIDLFVYPRLSKRITELVTPLKPLEAWAMGKSVLGSDVGGIRELCEDCGVGRLFKAESVDSLASALAAWIELPEAEKAAERSAGREAVRRRRDWKDMVSREIGVYEELTGSRVKSPVG